MPSTMDQSFTLGAVELTVADLARSLRYYTGIAGFEVLAREPHRARLGAGDTVLADLREAPGAVLPPPSSPGLSHFAPAVPAKVDVAHFAQRHLDAGLAVDLHDHVVSRSCYVTDPDGHTIEATWITPREEWQWTDGLPVVVAEPIGLADLRDEPAAPPSARLPVGTEMGHVQLKVTDTALTATRQFYNDVLGMEIYARLGDRFLGFGVADHRNLLVVTNRFSPDGGRPAGPGTARLLGVRLSLGTPEAVDALAERLRAAGHPYEHTGNDLTVQDPSGNTLRFDVAASAWTARGSRRRPRNR
ncbi:VOC family protein [Streptomyces sp. NPDC054796]